MKQATNLYKAVYTWLIQKRCQRFPLSGVMITEKALIMNRQLDDSENFKVSHGWLVNFCARHGIREVSFQGEKLSNNSSAILRTLLFIYFMYRIQQNIRGGKLSWLQEKTPFAGKVLWTSCKCHHLIRIMNKHH